MQGMAGKIKVFDNQYLSKNINHRTVWHSESPLIKNKNKNKNKTKNKNKKKQKTKKKNSLEHF